MPNQGPNHDCRFGEKVQRDRRMSKGFNLNTRARTIDRTLCSTTQTNGYSARWKMVNKARKLYYKPWRKIYGV